ncbi:holo-ACP synthase [Thermoflavimicrobium daqui]|uniref:Holo-[acyl-carrier-protein] synthase n=1 Tax=Thermoflavimicrobium daqui TaxID=2137476 RepID=A0A364K1Z8_9BACL|nr:holo-ACP synthase [Thermoflavimicrobium daqui]RAL22049.1 holo-ACP synthase [Thermoflavimicrobium daqui]
MIFGIGTDIIELERIQKVGTDRLTKRILTPSEKEQLPDQLHRQVEYLAGRFAAKEAISKALGTGIGEIVSFLDLTILNNTKGAPEVSISEKVSAYFFIGKSMKVHLSISHSEKYAVAIAVIEVNEA